MKDWHLEHMQKTVVKYVFGLSEAEKGSSWKQKQHKKYGGNLANIPRNIDFDIKHGVTREVTKFLNKVKYDSSFSEQRKTAGSIKESKN